MARLKRGILRGRSGVGRSGTEGGDGGKDDRSLGSNHFRIEMIRLENESESGIDR